MHNVLEGPYRSKWFTSPHFIRYEASRVAIVCERDGKLELQTVFLTKRDARAWLRENGFVRGTISIE